MLLTLSINIGPCPSQSRSQGPIERTLETRLDPSESGDEDATRKQLLTTALSGRSERKNRRERESLGVVVDSSLHNRLSINKNHFSVTTART